MAIKLILLVSIFLITVFGENHNNYVFQTKFVEVPLDHYGQDSPKNFNLRYLVNGKFYAQGGPVFLYLGDHADINIFARNTGFLFEIAPIFKPLLIFVEHRYYGDSLPYGNETFKSADNMRFLTTSQVLGDIAVLINHLKMTYFKSIDPLNFDLPIIAFGGGYGGNLAAWFRMKFPYFVKGAIASSAPMRSLSGLVSCDKFYQKVTQIFEESGHAKCTKIIKHSWAVINNFSKTKLGMDIISSSLNMCTPIRRPEHVENVLDWLSNIYIQLATFNYNYPTNIYKPLPANPVKVFCEKLITAESSDSIEFLKSLGSALQIYTNYTGKTPCNNVRGILKNPVDFAWNYQRCVELVVPECSTESDMFLSRPWDISKFDEECFNHFLIRTNSVTTPYENYGGINLESYSNIIFTNNLMDPWSVGGVPKNISSKILVFNILNAPQLADLRSSDFADNNYLNNVRQSYIKIINKWIYED